MIRDRIAKIAYINNREDRNLTDSEIELLEKNSKLIIYIIPKKDILNYLKTSGFKIKDQDKLTLACKLLSSKKYTEEAYLMLDIALEDKGIRNSIIFSDLPFFRAERVFEILYSKKRRIINDYSEEIELEAESAANLISNFKSFERDILFSHYFNNLLKLDERANLETNLNQLILLKIFNFLDKKERKRQLKIFFNKLNNVYKTKAEIKDLIIFSLIENVNDFESLKPFLEEERIDNTERFIHICLKHSKLDRSDLLLKLKELKLFPKIAIQKKDFVSLRDLLPLYKEADVTKISSKEFIDLLPAGQDYLREFIDISSAFFKKEKELPKNFIAQSFKELLAITDFTYQTKVDSLAVSFLILDRFIELITQKELHQPIRDLDAKKEFTKILLKNACFECADHDSVHKWLIAFFDLLSTFPFSKKDILEYVDILKSKNLKDTILLDCRNTIIDFDRFPRMPRMSILETWCSSLNTLCISLIILKEVVYDKSVENLSKKINAILKNIDLSVDLENINEKKKTLKIFQKLELLKALKTVSSLYNIPFENFKSHILKESQKSKIKQKKRII